MGDMDKIWHAKGVKSLSKKVFHLFTTYQTYFVSILSSKIHISLF